MSKFNKKQIKSVGADRLSHIVVFDEGSDEPRKVLKDAFIDTIETTAPYKIYRALLTQTGISAPVATVLENTLDGVPVWTRGITGIYVCTLNDAFPLAKTFIKNENAPNGANDSITYTWVNSPPNAFRISVMDINTSLYADDLLTYHPIEILVYP